MPIVNALRCAMLGFVESMPCSDRPAAPSATSATRSCRMCTEQALPNLLSAFRTTGGVMTDDALAALLRKRWVQPISVVARWIVDRQVVHFTLGSQLMLPLFQFDLKNHDVLPSVGRVIAQLGDSFDDQELAQWFDEANCWLHGATPAEAIAEDFSAVLEAARADRFALEG